jgi:diguanylate cyclase (GGDEF)-like protein/PAS domain S-box-containing protein
VLKRLFFAVLLAVVFAGAAEADGPTPQPAPRASVAAMPAASQPRSAAFDGAAGVIELKQILTAYHPSGVKPDNSVWYILLAVNNSPRTVIRVLNAGQPPGIGLDILPRPVRPAVLQLVSANPGVVIEGASDYGRRAFRVSLPANTSAALAVRMAGAGSPPSLLAWTEPALAAHNRWMAIFVTAVAGLIFAAAAIAGGLAFMSHSASPRWAAFMLIAMLMTRLAGSSLFDGSLVTHVGGPYGLIALFAGLSLAAGLRFVEAVLPFKDVWPPAQRWLDKILYLIVGVALLAYLGVPTATVLIDAVCILAAVNSLVYVVWRAHRGSRAAHALAPAALMFAMFALASAFTALGGFGGNPMTPDIAGAFAAAGAVLLTLALAAGEGVGVLSLVRHAHPTPAETITAFAAQTPHPAVEAIGASHQGVFEHDLNGGAVFLSREAARLLGFSDRAMSMRHASWMGRIHPDDRPVYEQAIKDFSAQAGQAFRIEFRARDDDKRYLWLELRATMKGPENAPAERCVGLLADVTARKESEAAMMDRSVRDELTGLGNRIALMEELEALSGQLKGLTYALIDIDRFKAIHASLGDAGGDEVLSCVAQRLQTRFQNAAEIFRVGGDAFALLFKNAKLSPAEIGSDLVATCGAPHQWNGRNVFAPISAGVASGASDPLTLINDAELALRQAKRQGGGCAFVYAPGMEALTPSDTVELEAGLRRALDEGGIEVHYQPIVRLSDRSVAGFEALLRWRHPVKGLIAPADFIAHSEASGLIVALGRFALKRAVEDLAEWQRYFPLAEALFVSVNLSRRQLFDSELDGFLAGLAHSAGLRPGSLMLEITESAVAAPDGLQDRFMRLRAAGLGLAIDDFGTGMSNLSLLGELPFDTVKIDRSFLKHQNGAGLDGGDVVLSSIIGLARDLKRGIIVEGVESEDDAARVSRLGCELAQGFLFSEPMPSASVLKFIARRFRMQDHPQN